MEATPLNGLIPRSYTAKNGDEFVGCRPFDGAFVHACVRVGGILLLDPGLNGSFMVGGNYA